MLYPLGQLPAHQTSGVSQPVPQSHEVTTSTTGSTVSAPYVVGVMTMDVEGRDSGRFQSLVERAVESLRALLSDRMGLRLELIRFAGPHMTPAAGAYEPLDFLRVGMMEKLERGIHFLLVVTEVDLAASTLSFTFALPSQLTNIGVVSVKRLDPAFWGDEEDEETTVLRLRTVLLHTFGHLLNLPHVESPSNVMFDFANVEDLKAMQHFEDAQIERIRDALPSEAHERTQSSGRVRFALRMVWHNRGSIARAVARTNPLRLATRLPTMITAALSVILVVFFSAEVWDVASTVDLYQLVVFSVVSTLGATAVLYRAFAFRAVLGRGRALSESTVVTAAATLFCVFLTMALLFAGFATLVYLGTVTIFPERLMETWPTVDPAVRTLDHIKLSLFVAALGTLAGSLGGRADRRDLVRTVLFVDEES